MSAGNDRFEINIEDRNDVQVVGMCARGGGWLLTEKKTELGNDKRRVLVVHSIDADCGGNGVYVCCMYNVYDSTAKPQLLDITLNQYTKPHFPKTTIEEKTPYNIYEN